MKKIIISSLVVIGFAASSVSAFANGMGSTSQLGRMGSTGIGSTRMNTTNVGSAQTGRMGSPGTGAANMGTAGTGATNMGSTGIGAANIGSTSNHSHAGHSF